MCEATHKKAATIEREMFLKNIKRISFFCATIWKVGPLDSAYVGKPSNQKEAIQFCDKSQEFPAGLTAHTKTRTRKRSSQSLSHARKTDGSTVSLFKYTTRRRSSHYFSWCVPVSGTTINYFGTKAKKTEENRTRTHVVNLRQQWDEHKSNRNHANRFRPNELLLKNQLCCWNIRTTPFFWANFVMLDDCFSNDLMLESHSCVRLMEKWVWSQKNWCTRTTSRHIINGIFEKSKRVSASLS